VDPDNKLHETEPARKAVYQIGANYQAIADYELAATWFERFARDNPKMDNAADALSDAVVLQLGLGQPKTALANAQRFTRQYGKRKPQQASQIAFAIGAHHVARGNARQAARALKGALDQIETHATPDVRLQTYALLGRVSVEIEKRRDADKFYGMARAARAKLEKINSAIEALDAPASAKQRRRGKALTAIGEALYYFAEKERAKADALVFPTYAGPGTSKDVDRFVKKQVMGWLAKKKPAIEHATAAYLQIVELNDPNPPPKWAIAAGAAVGDMWGGLVGDFIEAPYPKSWDQEGEIPGVSPPTLWHELRATYKWKLAKAVEPSKKVARIAYTECLEYGIIYQHFDDQLRSCEQWLSSNYPREYHLIDEYRGAPARTNSGLDERPQPLGMSGAPATQRHEP